ncbi:HNH endonuclease signature motif containing protein [Ornithinimicrobium cerasi]|uniref:HNH endonuclease n=1 Tax=Ornithinimicrobium cerasi TaxID=2248773 RepID=A0A285VVI7_9MICO|nr:HNH endonuclease signature motif containing protein [Ornithinimicrobium cerasi]SOC58069.1 hypothetical protein SAMN05421879_12121 [Ornithinimicrobium cerasi]
MAVHVQEMWEDEDPVRTHRRGRGFEVVGPAEPGSPPHPGEPPGGEGSSGGRQVTGARLVAAGADAREVLERALALLGLENAVAGAWSAALVAQARQDGVAHPSLELRSGALAALDEMVAMARGRCAIDATMLVAVQDLLLRAGEKLLAQRGVEDVSVLSRTAHQTWRAHLKAAVAGELQVALGVGVTEARQLVSVASAPAGVRIPLVAAMRRGEVHWVMGRRFQSRTSRLDPQDAADVAAVLFGSDEARAAPERLDPDGRLLSRPWHQSEYYAALDREITRVRGRDARGERERRRVALTLRDARLDVLDDGTSTFSVRGSVATMLALNARIDGMARRCRKAGDPRSLAQLRADIAASLLLHGTVAIPDPGGGGCDEIVTPDDLEALAAVVNATPSGQVELVVPWDAILGRAVCPRCDRTAVPDSRGGGPTSAPDQDVGRVGEFKGWPSAWVTPEEAREIALRPGSFFHRILTDPADGRCVERSISRYAPDAEMRRQVRAADVYGRGPGCRRPAAACELDHEQPWGAGGETAETNLSAKALLDHFRKTKGLWTSVMGPRRDLTWTTLLGQVARTRGHDYRQYADRFERMTSGAPEGEPDMSDLADRRDLAGQILYAALVSRRPGEKVEASDDAAGSEDWLCVGDWGSVSYQDDTGRRRYGAPPRPTTPEELLGLGGPEVSPDGAVSTTGPDGTKSGDREVGHDDELPPF